MSKKNRFLLVILSASVALMASLEVWRVVTTKPSATASPSAVAPATGKKIREDELGIVTLNEEGARHLGVTTALVEKRMMKRVRTYGGEVTIPPGRMILVAAPLGGTIQAPEQGLPLAGQEVTNGQTIMSLVPLFSAEASTALAASRADGEGQARNAATQLQVMTLALNRAQRLFREDAGSQRSVEEAQAQVDLAQRTMEAAESRLAILARALDEASTGRSEPIPVTSPGAGILRNVSALAGQNVPSGAALFEVVDLSELWVRVPVYVGDLQEIDAVEAAGVGDLNMRSGATFYSARPVQAPPSANPLTATLDMYYAVRNELAHLTPGQRVGVVLSLKTSGESLSVPWSAVVHDIQGGTWVYEMVKKDTYQRRRVVVHYVADGNAALDAGPPLGSSVVSEGAVELFGAETGFSK